MKLVAYCHVYCVGPWREILTEICQAIHTSGLYAYLSTLRLGVVGELHDQAAAIRLVQDWSPVEIIAAATTGWEQVTLAQLHRDANNEDWDCALYVHTKGVTQPSEWNDAWRRSMISAMVGQWRVCLKLMVKSQVVTTHWLAPEMDLPHPVESCFPAGNMWWARRDHLVRLPEPSLKNRHEAEAWIGRVHPTVADLCQPGWPSYETLFGA